nr:hypothetical protein [Spodoptera exigua multiple nucleopolyhedrovirus]
MVNDSRNTDIIDAVVAAAAAEPEPPQSSEPMQYDDDTQVINQRSEDRFQEPWNERLQEDFEYERHQRERRQQHRDRRMRQQSELRDQIRLINKRHSEICEFYRVMSGFMQHTLKKNGRIIQKLAIEHYIPNDNTYSRTRPLRSPPRSRSSSRSRSPNLFSDDDDDNVDNDVIENTPDETTIAADVDAPADVDASADVDADVDIDADADASASAIVAEINAIADAAANATTTTVGEDLFAADSDFNYYSDSDDDFDVEEFKTKVDNAIRRLAIFFEKHQNVILNQYAINKDFYVNYTNEFDVRYYNHCVANMHSDWIDMFDFDGLPVNVDNTNMAHEQWNVIFYEMLEIHPCNPTDSLKKIFDSIVKNIVTQLEEFCYVYNNKIIKIVREINKPFNIDVLLNGIEISADNVRKTEEGVKNLFMDSIYCSRFQQQQQEHQQQQQEEVVPDDRPETPPPSYAAAMAVAADATVSMKYIRRQIRSSMRRERNRDGETTDEEDQTADA